MATAPCFDQTQLSSAGEPCVAQDWQHGRFSYPLPSAVVTTPHCTREKFTLQKTPSAGILARGLRSINFDMGSATSTVQCVFRTAG
jgi:hypothetical protein